jgi:transcription termination/antitermination protein NusG
MSVNYYSVFVVPGRENRTRDLIMNRAVAQKLWGESIQQILIPTEKEYVTKNGERKIVDKKVFPGYLFVKMYLDKQSEQLVRSTQGVSGFVHVNNKPVPLRDEEIDRILKNLEEQEDTPKSSFRSNDIIKIVAGPFADFNGKVHSIDEIKGKIKAYVMVFGRDTLVELEMKDVEIQK